MLSTDPHLDDALIVNLTFDLAHGLHPPDEIAERYGLTDKAGLTGYLRTHPQVVEQARKIRAAVASDKGVKERIRLKAALASEQLIAHIAAIAADPRVTASTRIEGFSKLSRVGGVESGPASDKGNDGPGQGSTFQINFNFRSHRQEELITTVVDAAAIPHVASDGDVDDLVEDV